MREEDPDEPDWMVVPAAELGSEQSSSTQHKQQVRRVLFVANNECGCPQTAAPAITLVCTVTG